MLSENTLFFVDKMTDEEMIKFFKLICAYHRNGTLPEENEDRFFSTAFEVFRGEYDESQSKYREKVARMLKNRGKQEMSETSSDISEISQEISETSQEIGSNTIHNITKQLNKESKPKKKVSLPPLSERKEAFKMELEKFTEKYERETLNDFFQHWTQPNRTKTKMKFEGEKFWDTKARLDAWVNKKWQ